MIEDMTIRKFAPKTQDDYIRTVKDFSAFLGASPDTASIEDLRRYQLHLVVERHRRADHERHRDGAAVLLQGHAAKPARRGATCRSSANRGGCRSC